MSDMKPTNPKDSVGIKKAYFSTVPFEVVAELGAAMLEGARKYGRHNYRITGVRASVYFDAFMRHVVAWWEGQDIDADSGLSHLVKAMACLAVMRDAMLNNKLEDDRPPRLPGEFDFIAQLNKTAAAMIEKYPNPMEAKTEKNRNATPLAFEITPGPQISLDQTHLEGCRCNWDEVKCTRSCASCSCPK